MTIGDFAVVRDQHMFLDKNDITHTQLISALIHEVRYKQSDKEEIGFRQLASNQFVMDATTRDDKRYKSQNQMEASISTKCRSWDFTILTVSGRGSISS
jgi:hypothetical protein